MSDSGRLLRALAIFCGVAFVAFAISAMVIPEDRGSLQASATAFLIGAALAVVVGRLHASVDSRLERLERRMAEQGHAKPDGAPNHGGNR